MPAIYCYMPVHFLLVSRVELVAKMMMMMVMMMI